MINFWEVYIISPSKSKILHKWSLRFKKGNFATMVLVLWIYGNYGPYEKIGKVTNQVPHVCPNYIFGPSYLSKTKQDPFSLLNPNPNPLLNKTHYPRPNITAQVKPPFPGQTNHPVPLIPPKYHHHHCKPNQSSTLVVSPQLDHHLTPYLSPLSYTSPYTI